jgi:hypothetical protein
MFHVSVEPFSAASYRLPYDYKTEQEARARAVAAFAGGEFRTVAIIRDGKGRNGLFDVFDGGWSSERNDDYE